MSRSFPPFPWHLPCLTCVLFAACPFIFLLTPTHQLLRRQRLAVHHPFRVIVAVEEGTKGLSISFSSSPTTQHNKKQHPSTSASTYTESTPAFAYTAHRARPRDKVAATAPPPPCVAWNTHSSLAAIPTIARSTASLRSHLAHSSTELAV